ncbi:Snf7-domain-containing protein [Laetiporus sulphureus 93-53]|uniref:Vacuolar-sorting protein SNF7 n=1 Tax=Laetiporus sulphureus 93-53 TaxID=1314785 RepID=A0A165IHA3_9APHY|nr:Snf7-domain-containing protein [Laetiporus sulphureus 93-53]KZT13071.1 Snf7-domain-containing protein [Laetiporus sulphureus 93-53]
MMASFMSYFGGRRDTKQSSRDAIVTLRQQLQLIDKKEEYLQRKIDEEMRKARANAVTNKPAATAALRRKKATEQELERLQGTRFQLEMQVNTLESASFNAETMAAMKKASGALKDIHGRLTIDKVDTTMAEIQEQTQLANEVSEAISAATYSGVDIDEEDLKAELADIEQDELNERLMGADHVPLHLPAGPSKVEEGRQPVALEDDEEAQLKELQAALAM